MGHGYGWPSPYTNVLTESRQDGFGLNSFDGSGRDQYTYYGATQIKNNITLAPNAVVILVHGCLHGRQRRERQCPAREHCAAACGQLRERLPRCRCQAVFAFGWNQKVNYPKALAQGNLTMTRSS